MTTRANATGWLLAAIAISFPFGTSMNLGIAGESDALPFIVREGFEVEQIYAVPREQQGSWVSLAIDDRGRLIASDQKGSLYRASIDAAGHVDIQHIELAIGHAHGLLYAFDSLYAVVSENAYDGPGLYRIQDVDGDDQFDRVTCLQSLGGTGEHGPHSLTLSPDGKSIYVVAGNKTQVPEAALEDSLVPQHWGEEDLLPRIWGPIGSEAGTPAPGGWIASTDSKGKQWSLHAIGLRNAFDIAFHRSGSLFTVDADAEFDLGTPWYQPTRVFHVVDGTDYGWRSGSAKWPPYYPDTLPPVVELGPGSPTGIAFGYGTRFPTRFQEALFVGDWSHGRLLSVHLEQQGCSYRGTVEEIISGTPLPISDLVVHPAEGVIYFTLGGRGTTSGVYRLKWVGGDDVPEASRQSAASTIVPARAPACTKDAQELDNIWSQLGSADPVIRHRSRIALERLPPQRWQEKALGESNSATKLTALLALCRSADDSIRPRILDALVQMPWSRLSYRQRLNCLRCMELNFIRWGERDELASENQNSYARARLFLEPKFPTGDFKLDSQLCKLLVYFDSPCVPKIAMKWIEDAVTPEQQLAFAIHLRHQREGWTDDLVTRFFAFLGQAASWQGGLSLSEYIAQIRDNALNHVSEAQREEMTSLSKPDDSISHSPAKARSFVRQWKLGDLLSLKDERIAAGDPLAGRKLFSEANCFACHRFRNEGGAVGPDLTSVAKRMNTRDLLEAILDPDRVVSDQFAASRILTTDGRVITGRVVNLAGGALLVQTDMLNPAKLERVPQDDIEEMQRAGTSMMPTGLLNTFERDEILDLLCYLKSQHSQSMD